MHTFSESATGVPAFLAKLWRLVEDPDTNNLIYWQSVSNTGFKMASPYRVMCSCFCEFLFLFVYVVGII